MVATIYFKKIHRPDLDILAARVCTPSFLYQSLLDSTCGQKCSITPSQILRARSAENQWRLYVLRYGQESINVVVYREIITAVSNQKGCKSCREKGNWNDVEP